MGALLTGAVIIPMNNVNAASTDAPTITYQAHVENKGWMDKVSTSTKDAYAGTQGQALRMEALRIKLEGLDDVTLSYKAHIENIGDKTFDSDAEIIGTEGQALRLEAITVNADGIEDTDYSLQYRVHIENEGTTGWVNAGEEAGSRGKAQRLESIEFRLLSEEDMELIDSKEKAIAQLKDEFKAEDYTIHKDEYNDLMAEAVESIEEAETKASIASEFTKYKNIFTDKGEASNDPRHVKSDKEELDGLSKKKAEAVKALIQYVSTQTSTDDTFLTDAMKNSQLEAIDLIKEASTSSKIDGSLAKAKKLVVDAAKTAAKEELEKLYNGENDRYLKETPYNDAITAINNAEDYSTASTGIKAVYNTAVSTATNITNFDGIKADAVDNLTTFAGDFKEDGTYKDAEKVIKVIDTAKSNIEKATERDAISSELKTAKKKALTEAKAYLKDKLEEKYGDDKYAVDGEFLSKARFDDANDKIDNSKDILQASTNYTAVRTVSNGSMGDSGAIATLNTFKDGTGDDKINASVSSIVNNAITKMKKDRDTSTVNDTLNKAIRDIMVEESKYYSKIIDGYEATYEVTIEGTTHHFTSAEIKSLRDAIEVTDVDGEIASSFLDNGNPSIAKLKDAYDNALAAILNP